MEEEEIPQFAKRLKEKFPEYNEIDDFELVERVVRKHPVYASQVKLPQGFSLLQTTSGYPEIDKLYEEAGREYNVDPNLILEQGRKETRFKPDVFYGRQASPKGAVGAGQFMPGTAPTYGVEDRTDPRQSIKGQAKYMRKLLDDFDGDENLALAGYNSGEYRKSLREGRVPDIAETQDYVKEISESLAKARSQKSKTLRELLGGNVPPTTQTPVASLPSLKPVTESIATIEEQVRSALDANSPRAGVLLTDPQQLDLVKATQPELVKTLKPVKVKEGTLLVNPTKTKGITDYQSNMAAIIGKVDDVGQNTASGPAVLTTMPDGTEAAASLVTSPEAAQTQAALDQQAHPGATSQVVDAQDVVAQRLSSGVPGELSGDPLESSPSMISTDPGYLAFIKETGLPDSDASLKEYQTVQQTLAQQQPPQTNREKLDAHNRQRLAPKEQQPTATVSTTFGREVGQASDDFMREIATTEVPANLSAREKLRLAMNAQLSRYGVTPQEIEQHLDRTQAETEKVGPNTSKVGITYNVLANIKGKDYALAELRREQAEGRTDPNVGIDLNATKNWIKEDVATLRENLGPQLTETIGGYLGSGARTARTVAGVLRPINTDAYEAMQEIAKTSEQFEAEATQKDGWGVFKMVGGLPGDLSRLYFFTKLPYSGPIIGFAAEGGLQSAGRGESIGQIAKHAAKAGTLGAIFKFAPNVGYLASRSPAVKSALGKAIFREGATVGTIFTGSIATEKAFGSSDEQALTSGVTNAIFHLATSGANLIGKRVRARDEKGNEVNVGVDGDGSVKLLRGQVETPDVEMFFNEQTKQWEPTGQPRTAPTETPKEATVVPDQQGGYARETKGLLGEDAPQRIETADPAAIEKARIDTRIGKVVDALKTQPDFVDLDTLAKQTRLNRNNLEDAVMTLYGARLVELLPGNRVRLIGEIPHTDLFEKAKTYGQTPEVQTQPAPVGKTGVVSPATTEAPVSAAPTTGTSPRSATAEVTGPEPTTQQQAVAAPEYQGKTVTHPITKEPLTFTGDLSENGTLIAKNNFGRERRMSKGEADRLLAQEPGAENAPSNVVAKDAPEPETQLQPAPKEKQAPLRPKRKFRDLTQFVRAAGGIRPDLDDIRRGKRGEGLDRLAPKDSGTTGLVNKNSRSNAEDMAMKAWESGYLRDVFRDASEINGDTFLDLLEDDFRGVKKQYSNADAEDRFTDEDFQKGEEEYYKAKGETPEGREEYRQRQDELLTREIAFLNDDDAKKILAKVSQEVQYGDEGDARISNAELREEFHDKLDQFGIAPLVHDAAIIDAYREALAELESPSTESLGEFEPQADNERARGALKPDERAISDDILAQDVAAQVDESLFETEPVEAPQDRWAREFRETSERGGTKPTRRTREPHTVSRAEAYNHDKVTAEALRNIENKPTPNRFKEGDLAIESGTDPYVFRLQYVDPKEVDYAEIGDDEKVVQQMPSTQQYAEWFRQGIESPPITLVYNQPKKGHHSTNRRRVVAARMAGVDRIPAWVELGKHKDLIRQALAEGKDVPAKVLADYPDLAPKDEPRRPTLHGLPPQELTPLMQARVLYDREKGTTPADIAEKYNLTPEQVESVGELPKVGAGGQMSHKLIRSMIPAKAATEAEIAEKIAFVNDLAAEVGLTDVRLTRDAKSADVKNASDLIRLTIAKEMGKERGSHMTAKDWLTWLDRHGDSISYDSIALILDAFEHQSQHTTEKVKPFVNDKMLIALVDNVDEKIGLENVRSYRDLPKDTRAKIQKIGYSYGLRRTAIETAFSQSFLDTSREKFAEGRNRQASAGSTPAGEATEVAEGREREEELAPPEAKLTEAAEFAVGPNDIDLERARRAYYWTSFSPERRAAQHQKEYAEDVTDLHRRMSELARTPEQREILATEIERYRKNYIEKENAILDALSRTASSMVTGPANFPVEKNRKRQEIAHRRSEEFLEWRKKAQAAIQKRLLGARSPEAKQDEAWQNLKQDIDRVVFRGYSPSLLADRIERIANRGETGLVNRAIDYLRTEGEKRGKPFYTAKHRIWHFGEKATEKATAEVPTGTDTIATYDGATIINNKEQERVQILFDEKPDADTIKILKKNGWRWSPSNSAWQRQNTQNGISNSGYVLKQAGFEKTATPDDEVSFNRLPETQTDTPEFRRWFGDSKIVDKKGEPLVVYHGTENPDIESFRERSFFTPNRAEAGLYSRNRFSHSQANILPVFLSIQNPFKPREHQDAWKEFAKWRGGHSPLVRGVPDWTVAQDLLDWIEETGQPYDGIVVAEPAKESQDVPQRHSLGRDVAIIPLRKEQIKSAIGNRGTFDPEDPNILFTQVDLFGNTFDEAPTAQDSLFDMGAVARESEAAKTETLESMLGAPTAHYLKSLAESPDASVAKAAKQILNVGKFAQIGKKQIIEDAADALDIFARAKQTKTPVADMIRQGWLGVDVELSNRAKTFARNMESGEFGTALKMELSRSADEPLFHAAWHGSPHTFDKFDISKIGTGEGAQAYGYGLYFTDKEEVAEHYKTKLEANPWSGKIVAPNGETMWPGQMLNNPIVRANHAFLTARGNIDKAVAEIKNERYVNIYQSGYNTKEEYTAAALDQLEKLRRGNYVYTGPSGGAKYKVDLKPAEDEYLLWDKPLSEQSEKVKKALEAVSQFQKEKRFDNPGGGQLIYTHLAQFVDLGDFGSSSTRGQKEASEYLKSLGIRGIKYLDGGSRYRPIKDIKRAFLKQLPEDADFDDVLAIDTFNPDQKAFINALADEDWLGFDYPAQAISAALTDTQNFDIGPELKQAIGKLSEEATYNYVIFDDADVEITDVQFRSLDKEAAGLRKVVAPLNRKSETELVRAGEFGVNNKTGMFEMRNPAAVALMQKVFRGAGKLGQGGGFIGAYLNPNNTQIIGDTLRHGRDALAKSGDKLGAARLDKAIAMFEKATDPDHHDVSIAINAPDYPELSKYTGQEEIAHRTNRRSGARKLFTVEFAETPAIKKSLANLTGYDFASDVTRIDEVIAKSFRDDAAETLGLSEAEVWDNLNTFWAATVEAGIDLADYADVSPRGKEFYERSQREQRNVETEPERAAVRDLRPADIQAVREGRNRGRTEAGTIAEDDRFARLRQADLSTAARRGDLGERADNRSALILPAERAYIQKHARGNTELARALEDEVQFARMSDEPWTVGGVLIDLAAAPKSIRTAVDLSGLRQAGILAIANPAIGARAFVKQLRSFTPAYGKKYFERFKRDLNLHPAIEAAEEFGLYLSSLRDQHSLADREEAFMSRLMGEDPVFTNKALEQIRRNNPIVAAVRISERAYVTMLDSVRIDSFAKLAKQLHDYNIRKGLPDDPEQYKALAGSINYMTGRGGLGPLKEEFAPLINATIFSLRYWTSRLQLLNPMFYKNLPPGTRGIVMKQMAKFLAGVVALALLLKAAGADIEWDDATDPSTLKIKFGNWQYDLGFGLLQHVQYFAKMLEAMTRKDPAGRMEYVTERYLRSKLSPTAGSAVNVIQGKNYIGEPTSLREEVLGRRGPLSLDVLGGSDLIMGGGLTSPIMVNNFAEAAKAEGLAGAAKMVPEFFGISTTRYSDTKEIQAELAAEAEAAKKATTPAEKKEAKRRIDAWKNLLERARKYDKADRKEAAAGQ